MTPDRPTPASSNTSAANSTTSVDRKRGRAIAEATTSSIVRTCGDGQVRVQRGHGLAHAGHQPRRGSLREGGVLDEVERVLNWLEYNRNGGEPPV